MIRCPLCGLVLGEWTCGQAVVIVHVRGRQKRTIIGCQIIVCERCGGEWRAREQNEPDQKTARLA